MLGAVEGLRRRHGSESESQSTFIVTHSQVSPSSPFSGSVKMSLMGATDRTDEFRSILRSMRDKRMMPPNSNIRNKHPQDLIHSSREFMKIAGQIGRDIGGTYAKLEKLSLLAKRKTIFDDNPADVQELTYVIKDDMNALNKQISQLQMIAKAGPQGNRYGPQVASHSKGVVVSLQSKLANMTSDFKKILRVRTENLKESKTRQEKFSYNTPQPTLNGSVLADEEDNKAATSFAIDMLQSDSQQLMKPHNHLQSRAEAMENIESTIVELGGIFNQLAHMIKEQEEVMVRIDSNIDETGLNVEAGHGEILKYFQSVTSNRWLMIKIFGVLIFFFIFFILFMA
ncbi:syntaxin-5 [Lepeophtheirus salmonis]|uniref:syntaxin-5 n=1 Tax=Lepeophtheirus salmonis TaxID=72036 RepID=UPI001AE28181|nr:syntaxin-5-like [Lepeophtheirus salmonis]